LGRFYLSKIEHLKLLFSEILCALHEGSQAFFELEIKISETVPTEVYAI